MYSKAATKFMKSTISNVHFWACGPLKWNETAARAEIEQGRTRRTFWFLNFGLHTMHCLFLLARYIQFNLIDDSAPVAVQVYTQYAIIAYSLPVILHVYMYLREGDLASCLNNYMQFYDGMSGKLGMNLKVDKECDRLLKFMIRSGRLICWVNLIVIFRKPARPVLITSLLDDPTKLRPWEILPFAIPHILVWWTMWANMHLYSIHLVAYISGIITTTTALKDLPRADPKAISKFAKTYRSLQALHVKFELSIGPVVAAHKLIFVLMIIRSMYGAFAGTGDVRILQLIVGSCAWFYLQKAFKLIGGVHETCTDMLPAWRRLRDPWFRRFLKSCREMKVEIAGFYYVDRKLSLTLAAVILENIVNMLIANHGH